MSAIKRYIEEQATLIVDEYGGNVDDIIYEITSYIVDRGFSTGDAIQAVRANIATANYFLAKYPQKELKKKLAVYKFVARALHGVDTRPTNPIFPSLPITEKSARAIAEEIQEAIRREMK